MSTTETINSFPSYTAAASTSASSSKMPQHAQGQSIPNRRSSNNLTTAAAGNGSVSKGSAAVGGVLIGSKPTLISVPPMRFLIMDAPRQANLHLYIRECRRHSVTDVVRVCEPTYLSAELEAAGITLHEMAYPDGTSPPSEILDQWLALVEERFIKNGGSAAKAGGGGSSGGSDGTAASSSAAPSPTIAVHCVAGLGRAPVLVAIALVEFADMDPVEAVTLIRKHRRGAINEKQLNYLEQYRRSYKRADAGSCCVIL